MRIFYTVILALLSSGMLWVGYAWYKSISGSRRVTLSILSGSMVGGMAILGYIYWGNSHLLPHYYAKESESVRQQYLKMRPMYAEAKRELAKNKVQVALDKRDVAAWIKIAQLHNILQEPELAEQAYYVAVQLRPADLELQLQYVTLAAKSANGILSEDLKQRIAVILQTEPEQLTALNLLAVDAYATQSYDLAKAYWNRVIAKLSMESNSEQAVDTVRKMLERVESLSTQSG